MSTRKGRYGDPRKRGQVDEQLAGVFGSKKAGTRGDLQRLAQPTGVVDPRKLGGAISGPGGPHDRGAVVLDTTDAVLLESVNVATIDVVRAGRLDGPAVFMTLGGRINKTRTQTTVGYMFGPDGAAAIITELLALADRFGPELLDDITRRLTTLYQEKNVDLAWLRAAIDNAMELNEQTTTTTEAT